MVSAFYGQGTGETLLSNVRCTGAEARLRDCPFSPLSCNHSEDAGVSCLEKTGMWTSVANTAFANAASINFRLQQWRHPIGRRPQLPGRSCGDVLQWGVGNSVQ